MEPLEGFEPSLPPYQRGVLPLNDSGDGALARIRAEIGRVQNGCSTFELQGHWSWQTELNRPSHLTRVVPSQSAMPASLPAHWRAD